MAKKAKKTAKKVKKQKGLYLVYDESQGIVDLYSTKPEVLLTKTVVSDSKGGWKDDPNNEPSVDIIRGEYLTELCEEVKDYIPGIKSGVVYKLTVTAEPV